MEKEEAEIEKNLQKNECGSFVCRYGRVEAKRMGKAVITAVCGG